MKRFVSPVLVSTCAVSFVCFSISAAAQTTDIDSQRQDRDALVESYNQLQQKHEGTVGAQQDVSLDPGVIVGLLQSQPALALQIKRLLVKDALAQGRLLEEDDLTDSVLYDLIRREPAIQVIASKEIINRHYLDLKPTDEEILQARVERRQIE